MQAPTSKPPLLPPPIASFDVDVNLLSIKYSAAPMKSSNTFCFTCSIPASCHFSPYSPPPRRFGSAKIPPISIQTKIARSEERRVGKSVDPGGRRIIKKKKRTFQSLNLTNRFYYCLT